VTAPADARPFRVLITRPLEDGVPLAARLGAVGIDSLIEPLLRLRILAGPPPALAGVQALLATSANGVRAFCRRSAIREPPVFSVGDATGGAAAAAGFTDVVSAGGDVLSLAALVRRRLDPARGALLHIAGTEVAGDLAQMLAGDGFEVRRIVLYAMEVADRLSAEAGGALRAGAIDGVLIFSPRTGRTLTRLLTGAGLPFCCRRMTAFCLSEAVASAIRELPWQAMAVAETPAEDALIREVTAAAKRAAGG
jgi:uroporphyrinogen-III synthase